MGEIDCALDSLARIHWQRIGLQIDQERHGTHCLLAWLAGTSPRPLSIHELLFPAHGKIHGAFVQLGGTPAL